MNILLINHYAGSPEMGMEFRPYYFARKWVEQGHEVSVLAADYSHLRRVNPQVEYDLKCEKIDGISYYWIKTKEYKSNGVKRALSMFEFVHKARRNVPKLISMIMPDVVICSSTYPLDTYIGQRIKRISNKTVKLVHEIHDMWPLTPVELGHMSRWNPFILLLQRAENSFCRNADEVVSLLPEAKSYLMDHGMSPDKYHVVTNGIVLEEWQNPQELPTYIEDHFRNMKQKGYTNICFCGSIHKASALEFLIKAAAQMDNVSVTFIGPGFDRNDLEKEAEPYADRIKFFNAIPKRCMPNVFKEIDIFYVGSLDYPLNRFGICMNKVFDAMMGGKPILYAVKGPNNYVEDYQCGITIPPENTEALIEGIKKLECMTETEKRIMGENGRKAALNIFNYDKLAQKFLEVLE